MQRLEIRVYAAALAILSLAQGSLILAGLMPPVFSYSFWDIFFALAELAVIAHAGLSHSESGPLHCARCGAFMGLAYSLGLCAASIAGLAMSGRPVLGMPYANLLTYAFTLAIFVVQNMALGAAVAMAAASFDGAMRRHSAGNRSSGE